MARRAVALLVACLLGGCRKKAPDLIKLELRPVTIPGLTISLPAGQRRMEPPVFEGGSVHVGGAQVSTDLVWGLREEPLSSEDVAASLRATKAMFKVAGEVVMVDEVASKVCGMDATTRSFTLGSYRGQATDWLVEREGRVFTLLTMSTLASHLLHRRILDSAQCTLVSKRPPLVYPTFVAPEGFEDAHELGQRALVRGREVLSFNPGAIEPAPERGFYETEAGKVFVREHLLRSFEGARIVDTQVVTDPEGLQRVVMTGDFDWQGEEMQLVAMYWHCPASQHTFIAVHSLPRADGGGLVSALDDPLLAARCPAAQSAP
ncbi:MAG: hypothetical protein IT370_36185 [Deltaproteobacteria bacterium]|nr:hypothetical protein [Deltaproteobacteria bacterium]